MSDAHEGRIVDHPDAELLLFVVDEATSAQRAVVVDHLGRCAKCRASLRELRETCLELDGQPATDMSELAWERALRRLFR